MDDFYAARSRSIPPLPWPTIAPPFSDRYVATISKARRQGRILIDYLRNQRGATAVAPYSPRARPGAPVSTPLRWEELDSGIGPDWFTISNLPARLDTLRADPWQGFREAVRPVEAG